MNYTLQSTDFGRSDTRANLRLHFEVGRFYVAHAVIAALAAGPRRGRKRIVVALTKGAR